MSSERRTPAPGSKAAIKTILKEVRGLIESGWTVVALARDATGAQCNPTSHKATSWSLYGAIQKAVRSPFASALVVYNSLHRALPSGTKTVREFNDAPDRTREEILAVIDRAIEIEGRR